MKFINETKILARLLVIALALFLLQPACTKKSPTNPPQGKNSNQVVVTDDTLKQIGAQVERAKTGVQAVGAFKRGAFKDKIITAEQSRTITLASQQALKILGEVNKKLSGYAELDEAARADLKPLISSAVDSLKNLNDQDALGIKNPDTRRQFSDLVTPVNAALKIALNLLERGN